MSNEFKFEVGGRYRNRLGWYEVLGINGDQLRVRYEKDGREDVLSAKLQARIIVNLSREEEFISPIMESRDKFFFYIRECNTRYRFGHDLRRYQRVIQMHREKKTLSSLLEEDDFYVLIYNTLKAWNMNQQGAKLTSFDNFKKSILRHRLDLENLYKHKLHTITVHEITSEIIRLLERVFCGLEVMKSQRRIVGVSKTLHFLIPDLIMPVDGKYTMTYFYGYNKYSKNSEAEFKTFKEIFLETHKIVRHLNLTQQDVDNQDWNTSVPKLIDNAIIGFFKHWENRSREGRRENA